MRRSQRLPAGLWAVLTAVSLLAAAAGAPGARAEDDPAAPAARPAVPACDDARARRAAERVQARYDSVRHLSADFEQTTRSVVMGLSAFPEDEDRASVSRGRVVFAKPGRMRWDYREPAESRVVSDGRVLWIHDVSAGQVTRLPVGERALAGAALQFLLGEGRLDETFTIAPAACRGQTVELELRPLEPTTYERLGLVADEETGLISETVIVDLFGNETRIRFGAIDVETPPPAGTFDFRVPEGVEVVDLEGPS